MKIYSLASGVQSGVTNMALDEALLEYCRGQSDNILVVRTYGWEGPTWSFGVHQPWRDVAAVLQPRAKGSEAPEAQAVRRPTGGRAILHGEDCSFAFISNHPAWIRQPLRDNYCVLTQFLKSALMALGQDFVPACDADTRAYLRSPACFETRTPWDLLSPSGQKLSGSAQLRRAGGMLHHGSAFLPKVVSLEAFHEALLASVAQGFPDIVPEPWNPETPLPDLIPVYAKASAEIWANVATTAGSHFVPASS